MSNVFLGEPSEYIKNWFIETYLTGPDYSNWPTYTTLEFKDGTTQTKEISGIATCENIGVKNYIWSEDNYTLKYIKIGTNVSGIADGALSGCLVLEKVELPNTIKYIGDNTHDGRVIGNCSSLTSITIPNSVSSIGLFSFGNCSSLISIMFEGKTMDQIKAMENYPWGAATSAIVPGIK